jgi:hypothetical protein
VKFISLGVFSDRTGVNKNQQTLAYNAMAEMRPFTYWIFYIFKLIANTLTTAEFIFGITTLSSALSTSAIL